MADQYEMIKQNTRDKIFTAFVDLIREKPYRDITVRELADRADISFRTFYHHYDDKDAFVDAIVVQFVQDIEAIIMPAESLEDIRANLTRGLELIRDNAALVQALSRLPEREQRLAPLYAKVGSDLIAMRPDDDMDEATKTMLAFHFGSAQFMLVLWWVVNDMPLPLDTMVDHIMALVMDPIWHFDG